MQEGFGQRGRDLDIRGMAPGDVAGVQQVSHGFFGLQIRHVRLLLLLNARAPPLRLMGDTFAPSNACNSSRMQSWT